MSKKDYKNGMEAGAEPFEEKCEKQGDAVQRVGERISEKIEDIGSVTNVLIKDMTSLQKKKLYDLDTQYDLRDLDTEEKEFLLAGLYTLADKCAQVTGHQQTFLRSIQAYLDVANFQTDVDLSKVANIEAVSAQTAIMQTFMEFLFLEKENKSFLRRHRNVFKYFNVSKKGQREILERINKIHRVAGAQGLAEKYGDVSEKRSVERDADQRDEVLDGERASLVIDSILHIASDEKKVISNMNININATIRCEGHLAFENCQLTYFDGDPSCRIVVEEEASLEIRNSKVVCEYQGKSSEKDTDVTFFIDVASNADISFCNIEFLKCALFLESDHKSNVVFEDCKIIQPPTPFSRQGRDSKLEMKKCRILLVDEPFTLSRCFHSVFSSVPSSANDFYLSDCSVEGSQGWLEKEKEFDLFDLTGAIYERCSFVGVRGCIEGAKRVLKCEFENSKDVLNLCVRDVEAVVSDCVFKWCENVVQDLQSGSTVGHCRFDGCKNILISTQCGGVTVEYCDFNNIFTDADFHGTSSLFFGRGRDPGRVSTVKNSTFNGVNLSEGYLIGGEVFLKSHKSVSIDNCDFRECVTRRKSGGIIKIRSLCLSRGASGKLLKVEAVTISNSRGLNKVRVEEVKNDPSEQKKM